MDMPFLGQISHMRFLLRDAGWAADIRNVHLLIPDGTVMLKYEFY